MIKISSSRILSLSSFISFLILSICFILVVSFFNVYLRNIKYASSNQENGHIEYFNPSNITRGKCDLFKGNWIPDARGSLYSNNSCATIPDNRNCLKYGRTNTEFLNYRWKPDECELPRFNPKEFLYIVRGKTMAFIGDSIARNQMDSLLCLLSLVEAPSLVYKDAEGKVATWKFTKHNFVLRVLWASYLVDHTERTIDDTFDLHLDKLDNNWFEQLPSLDYAVINNGHWYFLHNYLYENGSLIGCNNCGVPNVALLNHHVALRKAFRTVFKGMNNCKNCRKLRVFAVTENTPHYGDGDWDTGGRCNRTKPYVWEEVPDWGDLSLRNLLVEEIDIARSEGRENGNVSFDILDITRMMIVRSDGHPNENHGKYVRSGRRDCLHWCLPGPIDTWNQLMLEMLMRSSI